MDQISSPLLWSSGLNHTRQKSLVTSKSQDSTGNLFFIKMAARPSGWWIKWYFELLGQYVDLVKVLIYGSCIAKTSYLASSSSISRHCLLPWVF